MILVYTCNIILYSIASAYFQWSLSSSQTLQSNQTQIGVTRCELCGCTFHTTLLYYANFYNFFSFCKACHLEICFSVTLTLQRLKKSDFISYSVIAEGCVNSILCQLLSVVPFILPFRHFIIVVRMRHDNPPLPCDGAGIACGGRSAAMLVMSSISSTLSRLNEKMRNGIICRPLSQLCIVVAGMTARSSTQRLCGHRVFSTLLLRQLEVIGSYVSLSNVIGTSAAFHRLVSFSFFSLYFSIYILENFLFPLHGEDRWLWGGAAPTFLLFIRLY